MWIPVQPITLAARSKAITAIAPSNNGIVGSNPTRGMDVCVRLFCVGSGLATGLSPVQGVLPTMYKKRKKRPRSTRTAEPQTDCLCNNTFASAVNEHQGNSVCKIVNKAFIMQRTTLQYPIPIHSRLPVGARALNGQSKFVPALGPFRPHHFIWRPLSIILRHISPRCGVPPQKLTVALR
jgi:hypothetical protein